jgi:hypothetical protein
MSGDAEFGTCEMCGKERNLQRTVFRYNIKCECHSPYHFEMVCHCSDCIPEEPEVTKVYLRTKELDHISYIINE